MSPNRERAAQLMEEAHQGQVRMGGEPYKVHPLAVEEILLGQGHSETTGIAGLLHDTVEDTSLTFADLRAEGFGDEVLIPLDYLTKRDDPEFYDDLFAQLTSEQRRDYVTLRQSGYVSHKHALSLIRCAYAPHPRARAVKIADASSNLNDTLKLIDIAQPDPKHVRQLGKYGLSLTYLTSFPIALT